ncbi:MAG: BrnT family toxin [Verrucomicrobiales bacterium]|jgi:uncharacterized DUF497 family protein|nr:BrnT family toxin [Verrucomicrobiales bacterium]
MEFEFDPAKSASNQAKHGIDFVAAQKLWKDGKALVVPLRFENEERNGALGLINGKLWLMVFTMRGEKLRIISVRRARETEKGYYENNRSND